MSLLTGSYNVTFCRCLIKLALIKIFLFLFHISQPMIAFPRFLMFSSSLKSLQPKCLESTGPGNGTAPPCCRLLA